MPPPAFSVTARAEANAAVFCNVPPSKVRPPLAAPRLASLETRNVPAWGRAQRTGEMGVLARVSFGGAR